MELVLALAVLVLLIQVALLAYARRYLLAAEARIRAIRISAPALSVADLDAVDFDTPQPPVQVPHSHVWGPQPTFEDATSRTYTCQVPRCSRIHTIAR